MSYSCQLVVQMWYSDEDRMGLCDVGPKGRNMVTTIKQLITFACPQCGQVHNWVLTGTGLTAESEIQKHRYVFASCTRCGYTQVFNVRILQGQTDPNIVLESLFAD